MSDTNIMTDVELRDALLAAFPPEPITLEMFADPGGTWELYYDDAKAFESSAVGKPWSRIDYTTIEAHSEAIRLVGLSAFVVLLPAYLLYLVEHDAFNDVPFHTAGVLTRGHDESAKGLFDEYIGALTATQCAVVKDVILALSRREPMEHIMKEALRSYWRDLAPAAHTTQQKGP